MGTEIRPWKGGLNRGSFQTPGNPLTGGSGGSFRISEGKLTERKNKYLSGSSYRFGISLIAVNFFESKNQGELHSKLMLMKAFLNKGMSA